MKKLSLKELLKHIDPSRLNYQEWLNVGFALHHEGYSVHDFDSWSAQDGTKYKEGECQKKWNSFGDGSQKVTGGTIFNLATQQGWSPGNDTENKALDWNSVIDEDYNFIDADWLEGETIIEPDTFNPKEEMTRYLKTLFNNDDYVSFVTESMKTKEGKLVPANKGAYGRTAGQLLHELKKDTPFEFIFGASDPEGGAWIRFNPVDGKGVKNDNITDYRYVLVESDDMDLEKQNALIRELELPTALLMYSGGKSLHAIVRIEANNYEEYRKRVDFLYKICKDNGLSVDTQAKNPSRLSRMPGVMRGENKQHIIDTNIGKKSWSEWENWVEDINDDLPDPEPLDEVWDNMPELSPPLIHNVLRRGHKMLIAGPSKAGKSFALIQLTIAIAEGKKWLGFDCEKGRVLYVNLELDRPSALHRFKDVYKAMGVAPTNISNIEIWNLRGKTSPLDKLTPKLIRRSEKRNYDAVIIDPIYKVLTGDENSASEMAYFTNQFDKIANELGSSVIYCHHHSKGAQGGKNSMDRSSGSGVFARDPDAILDLVELEVTDSLLDNEENVVKSRLYNRELKRLDPDYYSENVDQDEIYSATTMRQHIGNSLPISQRNLIDIMAENAVELITQKSAWRVEATLREYAGFDPINMWFEYPIHVLDESGGMQDLDIDGQQPKWKGNLKNKKTPEQRLLERVDSFNITYSGLAMEGNQVTINELAESLGVTEKTVRNRIKEAKDYWVDDGIVGKKAQ